MIIHEIHIKTKESLQNFYSIYKSLRGISSNFRVVATNEELSEDELLNYFEQFTAIADCNIDVYYLGEYEKEKIFSHSMNIKNELGLNNG